MSSKLASKVYARRRGLWEALDRPMAQRCGCCFQVEDVITTGYKWLRAVAKGEFTGVHTDRVFLGRGSSRVLTAWLPLGKVCCHRTSQSQHKQILLSDSKVANCSVSCMAVAHGPCFSPTSFRDKYVRTVPVKELQSPQHTPPQ